MALPGLIDLRDLTVRYAWEERHITRFLRSLDLEPQGSARTQLAPPAVLLVIAPLEHPELLERSKAWLEDAIHLIVLRERTDQGKSDDLVELYESEWQDIAARFAIPVDITDVRTPADVSKWITRAVDLAASLPVHAPAIAPALIEHARGPRFELAKLTPSCLELEQVLASQLVSRPEAAMLHTADGMISLADPPDRIARVGLAGSTAAVFPDGHLLTRDERKRWESLNRWRAGDQTFGAPGDMALGFDAHHPVGWTGHRMMAYWLYLGQRGTGFLSASDHDYPCGPGKKLYGYKSNYPRRVVLAPDLSMVSYHFDHDVLVTSSLPIGWRTAGVLEVADFPRDMRRALFFVHDSDSAYTEDLLDEDARDCAPLLMLGPSAQARYAVDLSRATYRMMAPIPNDGVVTHVGGPDGGIAVFDAAHHEVRRSPGKLLGGWFHHATLTHEGQYWREDLATGQRRALGLADGNPMCAVPIPGTANLIVVNEVDERWWAQLL